ncbi:hypothetical protein D3C71_1942740 [compost metagenome]
MHDDIRQMDRLFFHCRPSVSAAGDIPDNVGESQTGLHAARNRRGHAAARSSGAGAGHLPYLPRNILCEIEGASTGQKPYAEAEFLLQL